MIGYLEGKLLKKEGDRILVLANQVGYEVLLPAFVMETFHGKSIGDAISLNIYYHQTEKQPKPVLIGFNLDAEKEFFLHFISVEAIGPLKAVKALNMPVREIARAIEAKDAAALKNLKGIGERTALKIVASLSGKMEKFVLIRKEEEPPGVVPDVANQVYEVLVSQLGHKPLDAKRMINEAMKRNVHIETPEELFDEVYRGERNK